MAIHVPADLADREPDEITEWTIYATVNADSENDEKAAILAALRAACTPR